MGMYNAKQPQEYKDGRTKQSFKDETDVNQIINKHARMGTLSHLEQWGGTYGEYAGFDFQEAQNQIAGATSMFEELPTAVKKQFSNDPARFLEYVNDPENAEDLAKKLPELAAPRTRPLPTNAEIEDKPKTEPEAPDQPPEDG